LNKEAAMKAYLYKKEVIDIEIGGINMSDYPKFCDAYVRSAIWAHSGRELDVDELEELQEKNYEAIYQIIFEASL